MRERQIRANAPVRERSDTNKALEYFSDLRGTKALDGKISRGCRQVLRVLGTTDGLVVLGGTVSALDANRLVEEGPHCLEAPEHLDSIVLKVLGDRAAVAAVHLR